MSRGYYAANYGNEYSRSARAQEAEDCGRLPRTRAAKELEVSVAVFKAACRAIDYYPSEWHHVGKYATAVTYYDTQELAARPEFWDSVAEAVKTRSLKTWAVMRSELAQHDAHRKFVADYKEDWTAEDQEALELSEKVKAFVVETIKEHKAWKDACAKARWVTGKMPDGTSCPHCDGGYPANRI